MAFFTTKRFSFIKILDESCVIQEISNHYNSKNNSVVQTYDNYNEIGGTKENKQQAWVVMLQNWPPFSTEMASPLSTVSQEMLLHHAILFLRMPKKANKTPLAMNGWHLRLKARIGCQVWVVIVKN